MPRSVPNYLTIDPATGAVGADFTGHIHALGLDLDAAPLAGTNDNEIHWLAQPSGAVLGMIRTTDQTMSFRHNDINENATEQLFFTGGATPSAQVFVGAAPNTKLGVILDSQGRSTFLQIGLENFTPVAVHLDGLYTTGVFTIPAGGDAFPARVAAPGGYTMLGALVVDIGYSLHNQMSWRPSTGGTGFFTLHNFAGTQDVQITYYNVLSKP